MKNGEIELLRIITAFIVLNYHSLYYSGCAHILPGGYIGVEAFFLLSGYLIAAHISKKTPSVVSSGELGAETYHYLWRRLSSFWPELFVACSIGFIVFSWGHHFDIVEMSKMALNTILGDLFLLQMTTLISYGVNAPVWYLSSLLMGSAIIYPLLRCKKNSPFWLVGSLLLLGYILKEGNYTFGEPRLWMGWIYKGNLRALAELMLGASLFPLIQSLACVKLTRAGAFMITAIKWGCYGVVLLYCLHPERRLSGLTLSALSGLLVLCFSRLGIDREWYQRNAIMQLGRFSLPLYLSHFFWAQNLASIFPFISNAWQRLLIYNLISILTALLVLYIAKRLRQCKPILTKQ